MLKAELLIQLLDSQNRLKREIQQPSRSFVRQFIQALYVLHSGLAYSPTDITNTAKAMSASNAFNDLRLVAPGGNAQVVIMGQDGTEDYKYLGDQIGIQVGTGVIAPTANDYVMGTRIAHGQAAGQFVYAGCEIEPVVVAAPSASFLLRRYFNNKSGGAITVNEVGLYMALYCGAVDNLAYIFLAARDNVAGGVAVGINELLRVQYTIQVTV